VLFGGGGGGPTCRTANYTYFYNPRIGKTGIHTDGGFLIIKFKEIN
jgi:hypothetical protein